MPEEKITNGKNMAERFSCCGLAVKLRLMLKRFTGRALLALSVGVLLSQIPLNAADQTKPAGDAATAKPAKPSVPPAPVVPAVPVKIAGKLYNGMELQPNMDLLFVRKEDKFSAAFVKLKAQYVDYCNNEEQYKKAKEEYRAKQRVVYPPKKDAAMEKACQDKLASTKKSMDASYDSFVTLYNGLIKNLQAQTKEKSPTGTVITVKTDYRGQFSADLPQAGAYWAIATHPVFRVRDRQTTYICYLTNIKESSEEFALDGEEMPFDRG